MILSATHFPSLTNPHGRRFSTSWRKLLDRLAVPAVSADKRAVSGISLATYRDDRRALANVERVFALGIDLDHLDALSVHTTRPDAGSLVEAPSWDVLRCAFARVAAFAHTTHSSTMQAPRLRVFMLLSRPVDADEYRRVYRATATHLEAAGYVVDRQASDASRFWYLPSIPRVGVPYVFWTCTGAPLDVEAALRPVPAPAPPSVPPPRAGEQVGDVERRAAAYLERCDPAISGSGGHAQTFRVAQALVRGFALDEGTAYRLLAQWNERCQPPWSERDLRRKVSQAMEHGRMAGGELRDRRRAS